MSSVPVSQLTAAWILELYRLRWQIELAFKRLKTLLAFGHVPKSSDASAKAWMQAKILTALLIERVGLCGRFFPVGIYSMSKAGSGRSSWRFATQSGPCSPPRFLWASSCAAVAASLTACAPAAVVALCSAPSFGGSFADYYGSSSVCAAVRCAPIQSGVEHRTPEGSRMPLPDGVPGLPSAGTPLRWTRMTSFLNRNQSQSPWHTNSPLSPIRRMHSNRTLTR
ncbi:MAG: transposase [Verrucomicrobiae bacterium]|nr:transposase [Verrucomicrobiae bacterium]